MVTLTASDVQDKGQRTYVPPIALGPVGTQNSGGQDLAAAAFALAWAAVAYCWRRMSWDVQKGLGGCFGQLLSGSRVVPDACYQQLPRAAAEVPRMK